MSKKALIYVEAVLLAGPLTVAAGFLAALALGMGVPVLLWNVKEPLKSHDIPIVFAICTAPLGLYALFYLWRLVAATARSTVVRFGGSFWLAIGCSAVASFVVIYIYETLGAAVVIPAYALFAHMALMQRGLRTSVHGLLPQARSEGHR